GRFATMRYLLVAAAAAGLVSATGAAAQAITTLGSSAAQSCYKAARDHRTALAELSRCDQALSGALSFADLVATHVNRGILHALREDYSKALRDYDTAIELDPNEAEAFFNKGLLLLRASDRDREALEMINLAIAKKTRKPAEAYFARAVAHEGLGKPVAAYKDYRQAAALAPKWDLPARELRRFRIKS
ncbi:MAG TPA: tetratricopeptide repeat protein, partial [Allosphingosinicella sp.]|nr:tetratricopeptide repeat protein [Allosphingosinicella sp.]